MKLEQYTHEEFEVGKRYFEIQGFTTHDGKDTIIQTETWTTLEEAKAPD